jgi:DNA-binding NtrC family response regulator
MERNERPKILLVDDDPEHNQALANVLDGAGYQVSATASAHQAVTVLKGRSFDLVIMDLRMPGKSGFDLLRSIRAIHSELSVIVITAHGEWTSYTEAMSIGAVDYLTTPLRREDILTTVRKALARKGIGKRDTPAGDSGDAGSAAA